MESADNTTQQLMFSLIEVWKTSGKSQKEFCREKDIAYHKFHYWFKKYNDHSAPCDQRSFIQLAVKNVKQPSSSAGIEVIYPDGRRLIINQPVEASFLRSLMA